MPELPEVEGFARYLAPRVTGLQIRAVEIHCLRTIRPLPPEPFRNSLRGAVIAGVRRRAKFLRLDLAPGSRGSAACLLAHLGMTGRLFVQSANLPLPRHTVADLDLGTERLVFEDARRFGRLHTDLSVLDPLGPEPLSDAFPAGALSTALRGSRRAVKVCLMDPGVVAGIGNIYASEALFRARIAPERSAGSLTPDECHRLRTAIRKVLMEAIRRTEPHALETVPGRESLFYHGNAPSHVEAPPFQVYDRAGKPCTACGTPIRRIVQASRSTFFCPRCQAWTEPLHAPIDLGSPPPAGSSHGHAHPHPRH
ncbi:MAG: bifunctional DNA-formamidopyrimidine glycosylase/DNA-(apurinic or apyrimidinic site) lyase [Verrucomicrobia bacterium]|nr:bifunctional DNA-formamidopyrimidine glycosylase/DNA-(apurinic or apyrimidinic site) lyase [Verrucomicrobiota bacterium]